VSPTTIRLSCKVNTFAQQLRQKEAKLKRKDFYWEDRIFEFSAPALAKALIVAARKLGLPAG
jgi:hypothetical protein